MMTKLVAIFYANIILFQSFDVSLEDASKWSALLEHAAYHHEAYGDSFVDFISEHYGEASVQHEGAHSEHESLPFKNSEHNSCHVNSSFTLQSFDFINNYKSIGEIPFNYCYKESISLFEKPSVFQPPKSA